MTNSAARDTSGMTGASVSSTMSPKAPAPDFPSYDATEVASPVSQADGHIVSNQSGQRESATVDAERKRIVSDHLKTLVEAYKHHFDLFVKGWFLYFAIVGAVAGYLGKSDTSSKIVLGAALLVTLFSLLGVQRCQPLVPWVNDIEESIARLSQELDVPTLSLSGARSVIRTVQLGCLVVACVGLMLAWLSL